MPAKGAGGRARGDRARSAAAVAARRRIGIALRVAAVLGVIWFAVEGGEYGTFDLVRQNRTEARVRAEIDSVQRIVDSLEKYHERLRTDRALQERVAREEFGMVKGDREILYRFAPADTLSSGQ